MAIGIAVQSRSSVPTTSFAANKQMFLCGLQSPSGKAKYKRYLGSPIRYAGGKSLAVGLVVELIPDDTKRLVSPFLGGGSIEVACASRLGLPVIAYDVFDILINYWDVQVKEPRLLYNKLSELRPDKDTFEKIRFILNDVWYKGRVLDTMTLAAYFVYNFNLSYGPGFMGWASSVYLNETRYQRMIEKIRDFNGSGLHVGHADFRDIIREYPNDLLYCDPPYYLGEGSKMFRGIYPMRNIPVHHDGFPHTELRDLLHAHKGGFILSYNDCPMIREYYKDFNQTFPVWQYTMGQGETRIGKNRIADNGGSSVKKSHELLIWRLPERKERRRRV